MRRKRKKAVPPTPHAVSKSAVLDVFTEQDLERWSDRAALAQRYSDRVYFELERQRAERYDELCEALRTAPRIRLELNDWARIVDYRWSLSPLSSAGSLKGIGGRPLETFSKVIAEFRLPAVIQRFAREHRLKPRWLARSAKQLHERILIEPAEWRSEPHLFGIPASNQVFGRIVRDAGVEALLYPSQQGGTLCLALFPQNFKGSDSCVRVIGTPPPLATCLVVDKENPCTN